MTDLRVKTMESTVAYSGGGFSKEVFGTRDGAPFFAPWLTKLALQGQVFMSCDADANDYVVGQTSYADTSPTFLITVPSGTVCMPLSMHLTQADTVAGGAVSVHVAICSTATAYASGGTAETIFGARTDRPVAPNCTFYSGATATTALLTKRVRGWVLGQDVSPAEGAVQEVLWTPERQGHPLLIVGPAALGVFTYAGTTGPSWQWSFSWAELSSSALT